MENEVAFGLSVVFYFFLSGIAGGSFICATLLTIFSKAEEKIEKLALYEAIASLCCLVLGTMLLFLDLGHPARAWRLFMVPLLNPTSAISWGSMIIPAHLAMLCIYIYSLLKKNRLLSRRVSYIGLFIGTLLITYTGFLLSICKIFPLWHSAILVPLFFASGCLSGLSFLILIGFGFKILSCEDSLIVPLRRILLLLIIADGLIFTDYYVLYTGFTESYEVAKLVLFGSLAFLFWAVEVLVGILVPIFIILSSYGRTEKGLLIASILALVGVFTMRYIIVIGGQMIPIP